MTSLSLKEKLIYSLGNLGVATVTVTHMLFLVWFFLPNADAGMPFLIPQESFFAGLTIIGLVLAVGRIFDAITDPLVANYADKLKHKKGKRVPFLMWSAVPFAASYLLVFFVPSNAICTANMVWIAVWLLLATFFLTVYTINYEALLPIMAKTKNEKIDLGTMASASWFFGFIIVSFSSSLWGPFQEIFGISKIDSVRLTFFIVAVIGALFMLIPPLLIKEKNYTNGNEEKVIKDKVYKSLKKVMKLPDYRRFVISNTLYTMATYIFEGGLIYFVTVLAKMNEGMLGTITIVIGAITLGMYPLINFLTKKKGRKFVLNASFIAFAVTFGIVAIMSENPSPWIYLALIMVVAPFSQAGFGILPVVISSDNAMYMKEETGEDMTGMFMAVSGFFRKLGATLAAIVFTSFLVLGKDIDNDMGIRLAVIFAAFLAILGFFIMLGYNEKEVMKHTK